MLHKKIKLSALLLVLGLATQAQQTFTSSDGHASGSGGTVDYSEGLVVYTTNIGIFGSVIQGVQQPFEISVVTGLEEVKGINPVLSAFPNPTTEFLILKVENYDNINLSYQLFDMNDKLLRNNNVEGNETRIFISDLVAATYFLKIIQSNKIVKTFKIVKN